MTQLLAVFQGQQFARSKPTSHQHEIHPYLSEALNVPTNEALMSHFSRGLVDLKCVIDVDVDVGDDMLLLMLMMLLLVVAVAVAVAGGSPGACPHQRRHDGVWWRSW